MNMITRTLAATTLALAVQAGTSAQAAEPPHVAAISPARTASTITTSDGVQLYYKDWGQRTAPW